MLRKPRRTSIVIGALVVVLVLGVAAFVTFKDGVSKCVGQAVDEIDGLAASAGQQPNPPAVPQPPPSGASSRSKTRGGCGEPVTAPPLRP
jgi:hypothetical protein